MRLKICICNMYAYFQHVYINIYTYYVYTYGEISYYLSKVDTFPVVGVDI